MAKLGDAVERGKERFPAPALGIERGPARGGQAVAASAAGAGALDPAALDQAAALEAVERGIERCDVESERTVGSAIDQLGQLVAVAVALLEQREDDGFGAAFAQ